MSIVSCCLCSQPTTLRTAQLGTIAEMTTLCRDCNRAAASGSVRQDAWTRDSLGALHTVALPGAA